MVLYINRCFTKICIKLHPMKTNYSVNPALNLQNAKSIVVLFNFFVISILFFTINNNISAQTANFSISTQNGCVPLVISFNNLSSNSNAYYWDFGNGTTSNQINPTTIYQTVGSYTVKLVAINNNGTDTIIQQNIITVYPKPSSNFFFSANNFCESQNSINFTNTSIDAVSWHWDFGDGNSSNDFQPSHTYNQFGNIQVTLMSFSSNGCVSTFSSNINILPKPQATVSVDTNQWCGNSHVFQFQVSNLVNSHSQQWNFGDGNTSNLINPNHQYTSFGSFQANLVLISDSGCQNIVNIDSINILELPTANIQISDSLGCAPLEVQFNLINHSNIGTVNWQFSNGISNATGFSANQTFNNQGNYQISAIIENSNGCSNTINYPNNIVVYGKPNANFNVSNPIGCPPLTSNFNCTNSNSSLSHFWQFGDGSTSTLSNPNHVYHLQGLFSVSHYVTDANNCSDTVVFNSIDTDPFQTQITTSITGGCGPLTVNFSENSGQGVSWFWDFGDGNTSNNNTANHTYTQAGLYSVLLVVENSSGCVDSIFQINLINVWETHEPYTMRDTVSGCVPFNFHAFTQNIGHNSWTWNFGDGTIINAFSPQHTYTSAGTYSVKLGTYNSQGCYFEIDSFTTVIVNDVVTDFDVSYSACDSMSIYIQDNTGNLSSWNWNFAGSNTQNPNGYSFNNKGYYLIDVNAISNNGCTQSQSFLINLVCDDTLTGIPGNDETGSIILIGVDDGSQDGSTTIPTLKSCKPKSISLTSPFPNANSYHWNMGDGSILNNQNISYTYNDTGVFDLTHFAYYSNGDIDTLIIYNYIDISYISANFTFSNNPSCHNTSVNFNNLSQNSSSWNWTFGNGASSTQFNPTQNFVYNNTAYFTTLESTNSYGCKAQKTVGLFLIQDDISFSFNSNLCLGDTLRISSSSLTPFTYTWNTGDGNTYTGSNIQHVYASAGVYPITGQATQGNNCVRQLSNSFVTVTGVNADFYALDTLSICAGQSISFSPVDTTNTTYTWRPTPNSSLSTRDITRTYNNAGAFTVSLTVTKNGCSATEIKNNYVTVNRAVANFTFTQTSHCLPITVNYQDNSVNAVSWFWEFGDGNTSTLQNPTHTFTSMPTTNVKLTIVDINGCTASRSRSNVKLFKSNFTINKINACVNESVTYTATSLGNVATSWFWDFGDGNTSTLQNPTHTYSQGGAFTITLVSSTTTGCLDTVTKIDHINIHQVIAGFDYNAPFVCPPLLVDFIDNSSGAISYSWDFGNGTVSNNTNPHNIFHSPGVYPISLTVSDSFGCSDTFVHPDSLVIPGPIINFSLLHYEACDSLEVEIINNSTNITTYIWDFGDGVNTNEINPQYTYSQVGTYQLSLTAIDSMGCIISQNSNNPINVYSTPQAILTASDTVGCEPLSLILNNSSINSTNCILYLNNSLTSYNQVLNSGNHHYSLIASNNMCADTANLQVLVNQQTQAQINVLQDICLSNDTITLSANLLGGIWRGNGIVDSLSGVFSPGLVGVGNTMVYYFLEGNCSTSDSMQITILAPENANILNNDFSICSGADTLINFQTAQTGGTWSGATSTSSLNPQFLNVGKHYVYHEISGICPDIDTLEITILEQVIVRIEVPNLVCSHENPIQLIASEVGGTWHGNGIVDSISGLFNPQLANIGLNTITYSSSGICPFQASSDINVVQSIFPEVTSVLSFCNNDSTTVLSANIAGGIWTGSGIISQNLGTFCPSSLSPGNYPITYTLNQDCAVADSVYITIHPVPIANFQIEQNELCLGATLEFTNLPKNPFPVKYEWVLNNNTISNQKNPIHHLNLINGLNTIQLTVTSLNGCENKFTLSENILLLDTTPLIQPQIIRTTVLDDEYVLTEWSDSLKNNPNLSHYTIYKYLDKNMIETHDFHALETSFLDKNTNVHQEAYTYEIKAFNKCNNTSDEHSIGTSILLSFDKKSETKTELFWTEYRAWNTGVEKYLVQELDEFGNWKTIEIVDGEILQVEIDK
jgi:PKD repeat protein